MIGSADDYIEDEDRRFFNELENAEARTYRPSEEDNILSKDLTQRREEKNYEFTTSSSSAGSFEASSPNETDLDA